MANISYQEEPLLTDHKSDNSESSLDTSQTQLNSLQPLLPRSAWNSHVSFLRTIFRAKRALDRIEQEAEIANEYH